MIGYEFVCERCGMVELLMLDPAEDDLLRQICVFPRGSCLRAGPCGGLMRRRFSAVPHKVSFRAGWDGSVNRRFDSARARDYYLESNNLSLRDPDI